MKNIDMSKYALLEKSFVSSDLVYNLSDSQVNHYAINNCRFLSEKRTTSITFSTSRIFQQGNKVDFDLFMSWCKQIINELLAVTNDENRLINSFAEVTLFKKGLFSPTHVLFLGYKLTETKEKDPSFQIEKKKKGSPISDDEYDALLDNLEEFKVIDGKTVTFKETGTTCFINYADELKDYYVSFEGLDKRKSLLSFITKNNFYTLSSDSQDYRYINGNLVRDSRLLGNLEQFYEYFDDSLPNTVVSEKGWSMYEKDENDKYKYDCNNKKIQIKLDKNTQEFPNGSLFRFVEDSYCKKDDDCIFICDDMLDEWADHIKIDKKNKSISFYLSKTSKSKFSASAFQDVVGQALKNLGNYYWDKNKDVDKKISKWNDFYEKTKISRIRTKTDSNNQDAELARETWIEIQNHPMFSKKMYLIVNFLSKKELEENMRTLQTKPNENFSRKNETKQILWFLNSLISNCKEQNVQLKFICKK